MFELAIEPFATMGDYCNLKDTTKFNDALNAFETCSHFDLKEIIETIASAFTGLVLNCGSYSNQVVNGDLLDLSDMETWLSLPRVPDECVDAMVGDNPFGNMIMGIIKNPEKELKCFADLADALPACTLKEWPIPIVGNWLKSMSCMLASTETMMEPVINGLYTDQLGKLDECLPAKISKKNCQEVLDRCRDLDDPFVGLYLPAPFAGAPMPDNLKEIAKGAGLKDTLERYEQYRQSCIAAEDRAIMERVPGITSQYLGVQSPLQGGPSKFFPGFLTGVIGMCVVFFAFSKMKGRRGSNSYNNVELKDLEFSDEDRFT